MQLPPATRLGPYEILALIGAGGMGEVYRARDTRLDRIVAIKTSKEQFSDRFEREARAVAALNHPHICHLYDVGPDYLVMEYIEGQRLKGPLPADQALKYGTQICDALDAAHKKGIIHRDLKPANILVTKSGVKLLDFGLAKMRAATTTAGGETLTKALTGENTIAGTLHYMSPEQLQGKDADARTDIFAFGAVLYEMLTGRRAFAAEDTASAIAKILKEQPEPISKLQPLAPPALDSIVRTCLEKDPEDRWQSARELKHAFEWVGLEQSRARAAVVPKRRVGLPALASTALLALVAGVLLMLRLIPQERGLDEQLRFTPIAAEQGWEGYPRFSPDGRSVAYSRLLAGVHQVFVRSLAAGTVAQLTNSTEDALVQFWSPDGSRVYYIAGANLWAISASGGTPQLILGNLNAFVARISPDGNAIVTINEGHASKASLEVSSPPGAVPKVLADLGIPPEQAIADAAFAPDGKKLLLAIPDKTAILVAFPSGTVTRVPWLQNAWNVSWLPDSRHAVVAVFTTQSLGLSMVDTESNTSHQLLSSPDVVVSPTVSPDGSRIAYVSGVADYDLIETSLAGKTLRPLLQTPLSEHGVDWSPTAHTFAYALAGGGIWVRSADGSSPRLLVNDAHAYAPAYSPDGSRIAYRVGDSIRTVLATGGEPVRLTEGSGEPIGLIPGGVCWSPDGNWVAFSAGAAMNGHLWKVQSSGGGRAVDLVPGVLFDFNERCSWSRDGRWISYRKGDGFHIVTPEGKEDHLVLPTTTDRAPASFNARGELVGIVRRGHVLTLVTRRIPDGHEISAVPLDLRPEQGVSHFAFHPDGRRMALDVWEFKYDIWMMEGFARPTTGLSRFFRHWSVPLDHTTVR